MSAVAGSKLACTAARSTHDESTVSAVAGTTLACTAAARSTHDEFRGVGVVGGRVVLSVAGGAPHLRRLYHCVVPGRELADKYLRQYYLPRAQSGREGAVDGC